VLTVAPGQRGRVAAVFAVLGVGPRTASRDVTGRWAGADHASVALLENPVRSASPARPRPPMASSTSCYAQATATAPSRKDCGLTGVIGRFAATSKGESSSQGHCTANSGSCEGSGGATGRAKARAPTTEGRGLPALCLIHQIGPASGSAADIPICGLAGPSRATNLRLPTTSCQYLAARIEKRSYRGLR
jgi:hypothetical protein